MVMLEMDRCAQNGKSLLAIPQLCLEWTSRLSIRLISNNEISELVCKVGYYHLLFSRLTVWKLIFLEHLDQIDSASVFQLLLRKAKVGFCFVRMCLFIKQLFQF